ncbi:PepSY-associated TM helix domain-containing protein, partial [Hymenobacter coccineus]|uniref:PepSY-associated TM helix domain-containing protein n=1 Tax=Hymenobacter coccineus TaxID=1908235 RepID=UPI0018738EC8
MKVFFRRIHLYLGLASGLFLVMVCLTGSVLVFEQELEHLWHPARYYVAAGGPRLSLAQLTAAVQAAKPKAKVSSFKIYADPTRTLEVNLAGSGNKGSNKGSGKDESRGAVASEGPRGAQGQGEGRAEGPQPRRSPRAPKKWG